MLIADIGGTRARFGLSSSRGTIDKLLERDTGAASLADTLSEVVGLFGLDAIAGRAAIAVAGPVQGDTSAMTNNDWSFDRGTLVGLLGGADVRLVNDFEAAATALPMLGPDDTRMLSAGKPVATAPKLIVGPGTGLGVATYVPGYPPDETGGRVLAGEGGHVSLAARTREEDAILLRMRTRFAHVSAERVVSGPGLETLHDVRCGLKMSAEDIGKAARAGIPDALASVHVFTDFFAGVCADAALTVGARGGVYLMGGVLSGLGSAFEPTRFLKRFKDKGRFSGYLSEIPLHLMTYPQPGLLGLTAYRD